MSKRHISTNAPHRDSASFDGPFNDNDFKRQRQRRDKGAHKHKMSRKERWEEEDDDWSAPKGYR